MINLFLKYFGGLLPDAVLVIKACLKPDFGNIWTKPMHTFQVLIWILMASSVAIRRRIGRENSGPMALDHNIVALRPCVISRHFCLDLLLASFCSWMIVGRQVPIIIHITGEDPSGSVCLWGPRSSLITLPREVTTASGCALVLLLEVDIVETWRYRAFDTLMWTFMGVARVSTTCLCRK